MFWIRKKTGELEAMGLPPGQGQRVPQVLLDAKPEPSVVPAPRKVMEERNLRRLSAAR